MTYSKIINIESRLSNLCYKFKIDKRFKFRFLTFENLKGIELEGTKPVNNINDSNSLLLNWYQFSDEINLSNLNQYRNLVLQLYSTVIINDTDITFDNEDNYYIVKNNWFDCTSYGPTCGIEIFNFLIDERKPIQEIDTLFRYNIKGNASLFKKKYLKAGTEKSEIILKGIKPYVVNYKSTFFLDKIDSVKTTKQPKSINKILEFVDNKLYPNFVSENPEINSVNARIEMIKFQLKNYFIENNEEIESINKNINIDKDNIKNQGTKIENLEDKVEENDTKQNKNINNIKGELKLVSGLLNSQISTINDNFDSINDTIQDIHVISDGNEKDIGSLQKDLLVVSEKIISNGNSINKINCDIDDLNKKTEELENEDIKLKSSNTNLLNKIKIMSTRTEVLKSEQDSLKDDISKLSTDYFDFKNKSNNLVWGNINGIPYQIDEHEEILNLHCFINKKTYQKQMFYLLRDYNNLILPYFVLQIKEINTNLAVARLVQMTKY